MLRASTKVYADLAHMLGETRTPLGLQFRITQSFATVRRVAAYADSRTEVRDALDTDFVG